MLGFGRHKINFPFALKIFVAINFLRLSALNPKLYSACGCDVCDPRYYRFSIEAVTITSMRL